MKKVLRVIRNIVFGVILVAYLSIIILASTLVLSRNDYGYTEFGNKALIDVKEDTSKYLKGQLVIVEKRFIDKLKAGDEIFVYQTSQQEKTVKVVSSTIKEVNNEEATPYITLDVDDTSWGQDYIAGQSIKVYDSIGGIISFVESKWIFFVIFIVPCFFLLLYEIYSVIIVVKFDTDEAVLEGASVGTGTASDKENVDNINVLMNEINNLKSQLNQNVVGVSVDASQVSPQGVQQLQVQPTIVQQQVPMGADANLTQVAQPTVAQQPVQQAVVQQPVQQAVVQQPVQQVVTQQVAQPSVVQQPVQQVAPQQVAQPNVVQQPVQQVAQQVAQPNVVQQPVQQVAPQQVAQPSVVQQQNTVLSASDDIPVISQTIPINNASQAGVQSTSNVQNNGQNS